MSLSFVKQIPCCIRLSGPPSIHYQLGVAKCSFHFHQNNSHAWCHDWRQQGLDVVTSLGRHPCFLPQGTTCHRQNGFYHQCLSEENIGLLEQRLESGSYPDSGIFSALNGVPTLPGAQQTLPQLNPVTNFPGSSSSLGAIPGLTAPYGASVTEDIVRVYIKMKIETNYTDLEESPEKMAWFKNDITSWMKGIATDQSYVQGAGVFAV